MLEFQHPEYLWYLLALPALAGVFLVVNLRRARLLRRFIDRDVQEQLVPHASNAKRTMRQVMILAALGLLIITFANPQVGTRLEEVKREGIDLFVALDVSLSMRAEDVRPNRLEKAKRDVSVLLKKLSGDRVGLIVFAGDAFVQFPLTADYSAADLFLSAVDVESVPTPGTMIASALDKALASFSTDLPTQKAIIVVSDGENTEGDVFGAVERAQKARVKVFTIGMGTLEGGPIPVYDGRGNRIDYKRDRGGTIVLTRLDESVLQQIASVSGGTYRRAASGGNEINEIYNELAALEKTEFGVKQITGYESQYQYPLGLAILLLLFEFLLTERRGGLLTRLRQLIASAIVLIGLAVLLPHPAFSQTVRSQIAAGNRFYAEEKYGDAEASYKKAQEKDPASREAQFNLGDTFYKQERYEEALRAFSQAGPTAKDPTDQSAALHNIGNTLLKAGKIPESIEAYKQALKLNPSDDDTRYNYQYARELLKQQQKNHQKQDQNKDQKQDQQENEKQQDRQENQQPKDEQQQERQQQSRQEEERKAREEQAKAAQKKNQLPKEQAEQILEALRNNEKEIQKQLRKREAARVKVEKDW